MTRESARSQRGAVGNNSILAQAGRDIVLQLHGGPPDVRLVKLEVVPISEVGRIRQRMTLTLKNNGGTSVVLLCGRVAVSGHETVRNCMELGTSFSLTFADWEYDVDVNQSAPEFLGKHALAPSEVVTFDVIFGRSSGGHELSIYRLSLILEFDEGEPLTTEDVFIELAGPTTVAGTFSPGGPSPAEWGRCMADNIRRLDAIGFDFRSFISEDSMEHIEEVAPGLMGSVDNDSEFRGG